MEDWRIFKMYLDNGRKSFYTTTEGGRIVSFGEARVEELTGGLYRLFSEAVGPVVAIAPFSEKSITVLRGIGGELSASWEEPGKPGRVNTLFAI